MAFTVIRTDLLSGTKQPADLVSVRVYDAAGTTPIEVENGTIVELQGFEAGEREVRKAKLATSASDLNDCAIVAAPEVDYDERKRNLDEYISEAGKIVRGYIPRSRNIFSITVDGFVGATAPAVGDEVGIGTGGKIDGSGTGFGEVVHIETAGRYTYYAIQIAKTEV
jgi:ribosomal protein S18